MTALLVLLLAVPPQIDIEKYLAPAVPPVECPDDANDFPVTLMPFDMPQVLFYHDDETGEIRDFEIQPGYLVSTCELMRLTNLKIEGKRIRQELTALHALRDKEFQLWRLLESQYETEIRTLMAPLPWHQRYRLEIGVATGVLATTVLMMSTAMLLR